MEFGPWQEAAVDLIGPCTITDEYGINHPFTAITIVDTAITFCKIAIMIMQNKNAAHTGLQLPKKKGYPDTLCQLGVYLSKEMSS